MQSSYSVLSDKIKSLITDIAREKQIAIHAIECRVKSIESFSEKISRKGKVYKDPLNEITDLCGVRVILYYQEDVDALCSAIRSELEVDSKNSIDKRAQLKSDQFGYMSVHIVCGVGKDRAGKIEWRSCLGLKAEIQVRTVLQHAWAAVSHALQYKRETEVDEKFNRRLTRIAGLLELSDEEFSSLKRDREALRNDVQASLRSNDLGVRISALSLSTFLDSDGRIVKLRDVVQASGFSLCASEGHSQLRMVCEKVGLGGLSDLAKLVSDFMPSARDFFDQFAKEELSGDDESSLVTASGDMDHWTAVIVVAMKCDQKLIGFLRKNRFWSSDYLDSVVKVSRAIFPKKIRAKK